MRVSWAKMALVGVMASAMLAPFTSAIAQQVPEEVRVNVFLKDADLLTATKVLTERAKMQFVLESGGVDFGKITLKLDDVSAEDAIRYICQAAGAYFHRDEHGVYIISHARPEVAPAINTTPAKPLPHIFQKLKLMKTDVRDVYDMVMFGLPFNGNRGFEDLNKFNKLMGNDVRPIQSLGNMIHDLGTAQTPSYAPMNTRVPVSPTGSEIGSQIVLPGAEAAAQLGGAGRGQGNTPGGNQQGGQGGQNTTLQSGTGLVPAGIDFISYDPTTNELVVRGSEDAIAELQRYISAFDVAPRQVQIKVEFVTTTDDLDRSLGYDFLYQRGSLFAGNLPGSFARSGDPIFLNYATGNITTRLRAALQEGRGKVVNAPIIRTLNNQPAVINSSITTIIFLNTVFVSNGTVINSPQPTPLTAQTSLGVAPRINDDGTITVYLNPTISQFVGTSVGPNGEEIPNQVQQSIQVVARVRNGETIVLGGLTNKNDATTVTRIPLLSDLPVIGQFFRGSVRRKRNSDLLIFVTPTVIEDDQN